MTTLTRALLPAVALALAVASPAPAQAHDGCVDAIPGPCVRDTYCVGLAEDACVVVHVD